MARIVIDPVTRIDGQLRIEVEMRGGVVADAWAAGTVYRGVERILAGRDPREAWLLAQRICGVCGTSHALASVRAAERALGIRIPANARLVRNLLSGSRSVMDHVAHFYLRQALDWVSPIAALDADPVVASALAGRRSSRPSSAPADMRKTQDRLRTLLNAGRGGPFANGYWDHPAYSVRRETSLIVLAHYFEALDWGRRMTQLQTLLGGKSPHPQSFLVGGMALTPSWGGPTRPDAGEHPWQFERSAPTPLSAAGLTAIATLLEEARTFVEGAYVPDVVSIAEHYRDWAATGLGIGHYLSFGEYPETDANVSAMLLPRGRVMGRDLSRVVQVGESGVAETVAHSHYADADGGALRAPADGVTEPAYGGPNLPYTTLEGSERYSWLKAPRYEDDPMEVGPAARIVVAYAAGVAPVQRAMDAVTAEVGFRPDALGSTLGRTVARAIEAEVLVDRLGEWLGELKTRLASGDVALADLTLWDPATWPAEAQGFAIGESPRGAVGHWLTIRDRRIAAYQVVDATTWNGSPRDQRGRRGAIEEAIVGTSVVETTRPVEILRTVHSFAPCLACAVH